MEEGSEAHMETDVSSTTEDVPEAQEVTGSNGNVETVVIVEKVTEDGGSTELVTAGDSIVASSSNTPTPRASPQKPVSLQTTPQKLLPEQIPISPNKSLDISKPVSVEHSYNKSPECDKDESSLVTSQTKETADSSSKIEETSPQKIVTTPKKVEEQNSPVKISTPKKLSPVKVTDIQKSPKISIVIQKPSPSKEQTQEGKISSPIPPVLSEKPAVNGNIDSSNIHKEDCTKNVTDPIQTVIEKEVSNDTEMEVTPDVTEKEHNKSISRELKSLIKSAKESKIISECTQLTTKRKSRAPLDVSNSSLNVSVEAEKVKDTRRSSVNSQKSNCSEISEKVPVKRSMRSQNPEFVNKVKQFLNSVTSKVQKESDEGTDEELEHTNKEIKVNKDIKDSKLDFSPSLPKKKKAAESSQDGKSKLRADPYCWRCHWEVDQPANEKTHPPMNCTVCPRSFHYKCLSGVERSKINNEKSWVCPECMGVLHAESSETRSPAMKKISLSKLCELLTHVLERMMDLSVVEPFIHPVDRVEFADYEKYVVHPMNLTLMKENIAAGLYGSTEAFLADVMWILHNSIIFNTFQSKLTAAARTLVRSCRAEIGEIEACPECYAAANARKPTWFTDVCTTPHILLWAKLKGFPYWPAKGMTVNNAGMVNVRFFGAHDRAWVPANYCFLFSEKDPNNFRTKRQDILDSMQEAEEHIRNISRKYGKFVYPPFKTQFDPAKLDEQLKMMIPSFEGEVRVPVKEKPSSSPSLATHRRSNSKSSKSSFNDGEMSEGEETSTVASRKMPDGADIARLEEDEKDKTIEVDIPQPKEDTSEKSEKPSRKRRRSEMEEAAVFTIISSSKKDKKKNKEAKNEDQSTADKQRKLTPAVLQTAQDEAKTEDKVEEIKDKTESQVPPVGSDKEENKTIKELLKVADEKAAESPKTNNNQPISSKEKTENKPPPKLKPIKLVISTKSNKIIGRTIGKTTVTTAPKVMPIKIRQAKLDKNLIITKIAKVSKEEKTKSQRRRNSKSNKSLNSTANSDKTVAATAENKLEKTADAVQSKDKKDTGAAKSKDDANKSILIASKVASPKRNIDSPKTAKERMQLDEDDTSLAVIAREVKGNVVNNNVTGLPTISCVRSLSAVAQNSAAASKSNAKTIEVTIEPNGDSLLIPTSTSNARKETPKAKDAEHSLVGRVGVRAFARMASPEANRSKEVEVEIKAEPIDFEDQDRQLEKIDMMKAFKLRPVNAPQSNLREVRINKVVMTPLNARKTATKPPEVRPRARKTFPQPRKSDDGRSELNGKNSMVYIPIQPPTTPGPLRGVRPPAPLATLSANVGPRLQSPIITTAASSLVNTVTPPLVPSSITQLSSAASSLSATSTSTMSLLPTIGQVPTTVHTVPLITSVNGQWTFSLQPIMSVGGLDCFPVIQDTASPPLLNGLPERNQIAPPDLLPLPSSLAAPVSGHTMITSSTTVVPVPTPMLPSPAMTPMSIVSAPTAPAQMAPALMPPALIAPAPMVSSPLLMPAPVIPISGAPATSVSQSNLPMATLSAVPAVTPNRTGVDGNAVGEPPRLQQRPVLMNPFDSHTPIGNLPPPSTAGPVTAKLNQNAVKLTDFFRSLLEDSLEKLDEPLCQVTTLRLQLEQTNWRHQQEIEELKHNHELVLAEMRSSFEKDKARLTSELRRNAQTELDSAVKAAVKATKAKQWCANCCQEAQFYCCWNTSYCDYPCQRAHWTKHFAVCTQQRADADASSGPNESRLQPVPDNVPKNTTAPSTTPTLTVGGKLAQARAANQESSQKQSSIIMSMVEDKSGNQTLRCLGTYKPPTPSAPPTTNQMSPIIINKQVINNDESGGKKVVTTGGYLLVGSNNTGTIVTPPRRTHSIQYYT